MKFSKLTAFICSLVHNKILLKRIARGFNKIIKHANIYLYDTTI